MKLKDGPSRFPLHRCLKESIIIPLCPSLSMLCSFSFSFLVSPFSPVHIFSFLLSLLPSPSFHLIPPRTHMHMHTFFLHQIDTHRIEFIEAIQLHAKMIDIVEVMKGF